MHLNKPSRELVYDLINSSNGTDLTPTDMAVGAPEAVAINGRNTRVIASGSGERYTGSVPLRYNRLDLGVKMPPVEPEGLELMVPNDGFIDSGEVTERLNRMFNLALAPDDVIHQELNFNSFPASFTLTARPSSFAWIGHVNIQLVPDRPMFTEAFETTVLEGFTLPTFDAALLQEPATLFNHLLWQQIDGNLHYVPNGTLIPADDFTVVHNGELEIAACARKGMGDVALASDFDGYRLALNGASTWSIPLSVTLEDEDDTGLVTERYDVTVAVTAPNNEVVTLKLYHEAGNYLLQTLDGSRTITTGGAFDNDTAYQGLLNIRDISDLFGPVAVNANGVPTGTYRVRLQARRCQTLAPRLLVTFMVNAGA